MEKKEQISLTEFIKLIPQFWIIELQDYLFFSKEFQETFNYIIQCYQNYPLVTPLNIKSIFNFFTLKPEDVNIVIVGQDPYPNQKHANGIAFSACEMTSSLKNIEQAIQIDCYNKNTKYKLQDTLLKSWTEQKIILINTFLTCVPSDSVEHKEKSNWKLFTDQIISKLSDKGNKIFLLMGAEAKKKYPLIKEANNNIIITCYHPSARVNQGQTHPLFSQKAFKTLYEQSMKMHKKKLELLQLQ